MRILLTLLLFLPSFLMAQFDPPAGQEGSLAIHVSSSQFVAWAKSAEIIRGPQEIGNDTLGFVTSGIDSFALNKAGENPCVSLGDGGSAILQFEYSIRNGEGPDFAVFENSFDGLFLELAFVEVSSDGFNYTRFPATSFTDTAIQITAFSYLEAKLLNNLAGKHAMMYGTPFDLEELRDTPGLDINAISHIRLVDVVGSINPQFCSRDAGGRIINDPFPTPFPSSGFDLDAVGVIHNNNPNGIISLDVKSNLSIFPQPADGTAYLSIPEFHDKKGQLIILTIDGKLHESYSGAFNSSGVWSIDTSNLNSGCYIAFIVVDGRKYHSKLIVQ
jgi:hypothetical protein